MHIPLVVTLKFEENAQQFFNELRNRHFPVHVNYLDAHLTLFHVLPAHEPSVAIALEEISRRPIMKLGVIAVKNMGNGVCYSIVSRELQEMHKKLQEQFKDYLINQDRQKLIPHITIQNKVTAFKAFSLYNELSADFQPFSINATGISSWLYLKGPWQHVHDFNFAG